MLPLLHQIAVVVVSRNSSSSSSSSDDHVTAAGSAHSACTSPARCQSRDRAPAADDQSATARASGRHDDGVVSRDERHLSRDYYTNNNTTTADDNSRTANSTSYASSTSSRPTNAGGGAVRAPPFQSLYSTDV